jgi:hypothetical protein
MLDNAWLACRMMVMHTNHMHDMHDMKKDADLDSSGTLRDPIPIEMFRSDLANVFVHYMQSVARIIGSDELSYAWRLPRVAVEIEESELLHTGRTAADMGVTYEHIRHTALVRHMEVLYEFAFHGRLDVSAEPMSDEGVYMWIADLLMDAHDGHVAEQSDFYEGPIVSSAYRCVFVAELANARHILEGGEGFSHFFRHDSKPGSSDLESLTVRQLALLAGMAEMSVRAAANPKRAVPLQTYTAPGGGTRIAPDVAKAWLQARDRYIPVTRYWSAGEVDLQKRRFKNPDDLLEALDQQRGALIARRETNTLDQALLNAGVKLDWRGLSFDVMNRLDDAAFMTTLADLLELPAPWLVLRARETATLARLAEVERELKILSQPPDDAQDGGEASRLTICPQELADIRRTTYEQS